MSARAIVFASLAAGVAADVYMQFPPGSNNRLDEGGGNRNNNNRLMDTQNNAKGGYGYGGDANNKAAPVSYIAGSKMSAMWTSQHSCGSENAECQIVMQYMCNDAGGTPEGLVGVSAAGTLDTAATGVGEGPLRDGTNNNAPDPNNPQANRGLHEPTSFYQACQNRERNKGLYVADQNLNNNAGATATRQNNNGARSALECPEERDYYPYWAPSPWKDWMIMTNNIDMCGVYQAASQNVQAKGYCSGTGGGNDNANNEADCQGTWYTVAPFNIPAPDCVAAPVTRDNHLGNDRTGNEVMANLTIPSGAGAPNGRRLQTGGAADDALNCVLRLRYNITTADTRACSDKSLATEAACKAAGAKWSAYYLDSTDGTKIDGNPNVGQDLGLNDNGGTNSLLELAVNTNQFGRTFQDRSHAFSIRSRPLSIPAGTIYNLNVKGKRGNIVQTYPASEYDFTPVDMVVGANDYVHVQWTGNDNTNNNGNNNGEGTNNEDRHNIVQIDQSGLDVPAPLSAASMFDVMNVYATDPADGLGASTQADLVKQFALSKQANCAQNPNNDQARNNCEKLNQAAATLDHGVMKFKPGTFKYMSTRDNNFSNRAMKASMKVLDATVSLSAATPQPVTHVEIEALPIGTSSLSGDYGAASVLVTYSPSGEDSAYLGSDGNSYYGVSQEAKSTTANRVYYWCDNGEMGDGLSPTDWLYTDCPSVSGVMMAKPTCQVDGLPEGVACAFQVRSAGPGGSWSSPSSKAIAMTAGTRRTVPGAVIAVIIVVFLLIIGLVAWYFCCYNKKGGSTPVPPPPGGKAANFDNFAAPMQAPA